MWSKGLHGSRSPLAGSWRVRRSVSGWVPEGEEECVRVVLRLFSHPSHPILCLARHTSFNETFQFLFWTMFGMEEHSVVDMPQFLVPEFVGRALYGIFTIVMVIVLLNMLIAMITNSFQKIEVCGLRPPVAREKKGHRDGEEMDARSPDTWVPPLAPLLFCFVAWGKFSLPGLIFFISKMRLFNNTIRFSRHKTLHGGEEGCVVEM